MTQIKRVGLAIWLTGVCCPAFAAGEDSLSALNGLFEESMAQLQATDPVFANRDVLRASQSTNEAHYLPRATAQVQGELTKTAEFDKSFNRLDPNGKATKDASAGATLSQNIYAGGVDALRIEGAGFSLQAGEFEIADHIAARKAAIVHDIANISGLLKIEIQKQKENDDAKILRQVSQRKQQSGYLGKKDLLESERETYRTETEALAAAEDVRAEIASFNIRYGIKKSVLEFSQIARLGEILQKYSEKAPQLLSSENLGESISGRSDAIQKTGADLKASDNDLRVARRLAWSPSLDLTGVANATSVDNTNATVIPGYTSLTPDYQSQLQARLTFSISLYNPIAYAQVDESAGRRKVIEVNRSAALENIHNRIDTARITRAASLRKLENSRKLATLGLDLKGKDDRLYEAGELDILTLIQGRKDLYAQLLSILQLENRLELSDLDVALAADLGQFPPNGAQ